MNDGKNGRICFGAQVAAADKTKIITRLSVVKWSFLLRSFHFLHRLIDVIVENNNIEKTY